MVQPDLFALYLPDLLLLIVAINLWLMAMKGGFYSGKRTRKRFIHLTSSPLWRLAFTIAAVAVTIWLGADLSGKLRR